LECECRKAGLKFFIWNFLFGFWILLFGTWNLELGTWNLELDFLPFGTYLPAAGLLFGF
jgi:hypothetical protein